MNLQDARNVTPGDLLVQAETLKKEGYRYVQIGGTVISCEGEDAQLELIYSFDKNYEMVNLRLSVPRSATVPSISRIFAPAFLAENEIHEHFGLKIADITIDFKGTLYKMAEKHPFYLSAVTLKGGTPK